MKIVTAPNPVLAQRTKPVKKINQEILDLIEQMKKTLDSTREPIGVGLAAPQVGKSLQIFIMKPTEKSKTQVFINPHIADIQMQEDAKPRRKSSHRLEGCLSLPGIWGTVRRKPRLLLSYLDEKGAYLKKTFIGFPAVIIQHEMDHLNGILFPSRVLEQNGKLYKSYKNEEGEDEFEEIEI